MVNIKINYNNIFVGIIFFFHFFQVLSIIIVDGYPQTNDILHIFKITPLEGNLKFVNGIYGPGYTYYSLIFSNSLNILTFVIIALSLLSSFLNIIIIKNYYSVNSIKENSLYIITLLFHLIILTTIGFNHSDSIFMLLFYNGLLIFLIGYYFSKQKFITIIGLLLIGISALFRHHGSFAILLLFINFLFYEKFINQKSKLFSQKNVLFGLLLSLPTILSQIHLYSVDAIVNWQTSFKLHYFFHGYTWGDWRNLKEVLNSEDVKNFKITQVSFNHAIDVILDHLFNVLRIVYPFIFCFLIFFYLSKKNIIIYSLILFFIFICIVLAGYHRGYYPGIFFCFLSAIICFKEISNSKYFSKLIYIFLFGHLIYVADNYTRDVVHRYNLNQDIKNNIVPILKQKKINYNNIFSDDYNFYTTKLDGEIHQLCNWGGWFLNHPYLNNYYPKKVLKGDDKNVCNVKALITHDKNFAEIYLLNNQFDNYYKFDIYYLFTRK